MEAITHIALVSNPAFSHQVSILEFAKRLVYINHHHLHHQQLYHNFHVTCIIPTLSNSSSPTKLPFFDSLPPTIQCIFLPPVDFEDLRNGEFLESQVQLSVSRSMPSVRETLRSLATRSNVVALVVDAFAHEALEFGKELNILSYIYFPCSMMVLSLCLHSSRLDETISCEFRDYPKPIEIPGCISVDGIDLPDSVKDRSSIVYKLFLHRCQQYRLADGILVNSFMEMEAGPLNAIISKQEEEGNGSTIPAVYPIGPITQTHRPNSQKNGWECLQWLDNQPPNSVIYISFGSGGTLSQEQINELALGLELSKHKFLWVNMRAPNNRASATYLSDDGVDPLHCLPSGFLNRTKGQGVVMCGWAPQVEVLKHGSVCVFLTHCGWNSILESIVEGVPMMAWPLFAEQRCNAAMVTDGLKVAVRPRKNGDDGIVVKEEIASLVKGLMEGLEGEEIRRRTKELQKFAACAMMEDGSSTKNISELALKWRSLGRPTED